MEAQFDKPGSSLSIKVTGRLDTLASRDFMTQVTEQLDNGIRDVTIDCSGLEYISSSGLRVLMTIYKRTTPIGGTLTLKDLTSQVGEVLNITGMATLFNIE